VGFCYLVVDACVCVRAAVYRREKTKGRVAKSETERGRERERERAREAET